MCSAGSDFSISYLTRDNTGEELYVSMLSDWDLDAAFFGASDPQLRLKVDLKPFEEGIVRDIKFARNLKFATLKILLLIV